MNHTRKFLSIFVLAILLALTFITPAYAFDGRSGDKVVIEAGEVINDDLYVGAQEFVLDGTVNGDLIVFAQTVTINGKVDGDLMAAARRESQYRHRCRQCWIQPREQAGQQHRSGLGLWGCSDFAGRRCRSQCTGWHGRVRIARQRGWRCASGSG